LIFGPVSLIQRRLRLGYGKTLALVTQLQDLGVISPVVQMPILAQGK
jgi:DNA segregation ATPase FtsK/SpoIIIE-like protein